VNRNNVLLFMAFICVTGLFYFVWTTQGSGINYLSESLEVSCDSVQRVYDSEDFYWKLVLNINNIGENDAIISSFYVSGIQVNSTLLPPPKGGFSVNESSVLIGAGESQKVEFRIDANCPQTVIEKITVSAHSNSDKMYNLVIRLI
jgi:hypothetical protein